MFSQADLETRMAAGKCREFFSNPRYRRCLAHRASFSKSKSDEPCNPCDACPNLWFRPPVAHAGGGGHQAPESKQSGPASGTYSRWSRRYRCPASGVHRDAGRAPAGFSRLIQRMRARISGDRPVGRDGRAGLPWYRSFEMPCDARQ